jgi:tetratricopeptide (TPR) repeat protein
MTAKPTILISSSHTDEKWRKYVQSFLQHAEHSERANIWTDQALALGEDWSQAIKERIENCDVFVCLVSPHFLSSISADAELETIREAREKGKDVQIVPIVVTPTALSSSSFKDIGLHPKYGRALSELTKKSRDERMASIATEIFDIAARVQSRKRSESSAQLISSDLVEIARLPETPYYHLVGRDKELALLDSMWDERSPKVVSIVGESGLGKSALVNEWLARLRKDNWRGVEGILAWSFYSQGTQERSISAESFLDWAAYRLSARVATASSVAKGEAIAEIMSSRNIVLILDGVEPLQRGLESNIGELKDQGLRALLRRFASTSPRQTRGLIVLTSRLPVRDIARWQSSNAPVVAIDRLSDEAGTALLRDNGVSGTDAELRSATHDFGGHPLALGLLASFLKEAQTGDVRWRDHIRAFFPDPENPHHDHARRVLESYEKEWLAGQPVLLAIMHMVGLFDRPARTESLNALRAKPVIEGLTDEIVNLNDSEWQRATTRLREVRLLLPTDPSVPDALDAHPLVREWFGERFKIANAKAWRTAHGRLFEHLRDTTREGNTPTLEDFEPLYQAIAHGCHAGRHQEALDKIYIDRICRRLPDRGIEFYARNKLGAVGSDLAALSWFFYKPFAIPVAALTPPAQSWVLAVAAFSLRAQGRFAEALPAMRAALRLDEDAQDWRNAAIRASNLSEAELLAGEVAAAVATAEQSVTHADRSGYEFQMLSNRTTFADALHAAGRREAAARAFADAERRQKKIQPEYPMLYSLQGYRYCDLLLADGDHTAARDRATQNVKWARQQNWLLDIALDTLTLGRALLGLALAPASAHQTSASMRDEARGARVHLDEAVDSLRTAGTVQHVPRALLARATFWRSIGDWHGAMRDLDDVEEIAEPGPMRLYLYLCDMALERARFAFTRIEAFAPLNGLLEKDNPPKPVMPSADEIANFKSEAEKQLNIAADYIEKCGYHRRDEEIAELQAVLRGEKKFADLPPRV